MTESATTLRSYTDVDPRIEAIICDLGGVLTIPLIDGFKAFEASSGIPIVELGKAMAAAGEADGINMLFELETGRITAGEFETRVAERLTLQLGRAVSMARFGERYFGDLKPNQEMLDFMRELRARGYRMALCTNNVREWQPLWRPQMAVDQIFDHVIDSGVVGIRKPDPAIYDLTLEQLDVPASAALLVDDMEINCVAAREHGLSAVQFKTTEQTLADVEALLA